MRKIFSVLVRILENIQPLTYKKAILLEKKGRKGKNRKRDKRKKNRKGEEGKGKMTEEKVKGN